MLPRHNNHLLRSLYSLRGSQLVFWVSSRLFMTSTKQCRIES